MNNIFEILKLLNNKSQSNPQPTHQQNNNPSNSYYPAEAQQVPSKAETNIAPTGNMNIESLLQQLGSNKNPSDLLKNFGIGGDIGGLMSVLGNKKTATTVAVAKKRDTIDFNDYIKVEDYYKS